MTDRVFKLGADPELFIVDAKGAFVSSVGKFGGTKDMPQPIGAGCAIQEDNVAVEFNIPACDNPDDFVASINYALNKIEEAAQFHGLKLSIVPSAIFPAKELKTRAAQEFGCEPDYNAWTGKQNPRPAAVDKRLRSSGGHVHFGWTIAHLFPARVMVRGCDVFLGAALSLLDPDARRRELYGCAGAFRPKDYGFEYRTPSNWWIQSEKSIRWVYAQMDRLVEFMCKNSSYTFLEMEDIVTAAINKGDKRAAEEVMDIFGVQMP